MAKLYDVPYWGDPVLYDHAMGGYGHPHHKTQTPILLGESQLYYLKRKQTTTAIENAIPRLGPPEMGRLHLVHDNDGPSSDLPIASHPTGNGIVYNNADTRQEM